ncbi:Uncharacterized protein pbN1_19730 [Aromatoleum bremense]|nr:Uncharacterized protein pbN1_19730 [Aromatoleum bremense]
MTRMETRILSGLSPRTRGKRRRRSLRASWRGPIPADAGETIAGICPRAWAGAYPRGRGGNLKPAKSMELRWGLSPRTRGKHIRLGAEERGGGPIPADAGETTGDRLQCRASRAYPRGRGGNVGEFLPVGNIEGLSPRTRGKLPLSWCYSTRPGPIPADAGETPERGCRSASRRAYPRGRGGNSTRPDRYSSGQGLSPRTRGKQCRRLVQIKRTGPIPADAGETDRVRFE